MAGPLIQAMGLTKEFGSTRTGGVLAVDHVSFEVQEGEIFGIVGESGSGKSTLARCVFGITPVTSGVVNLFGETFGGKSRKEERKLRSRLGMVFQDPVASLNPRMKIRDVIAEPLELHSRDKDFIESRVLTLIDRVGLTSNHLERRAHELSGGQCQRVAIARALSTNPKAILLDEPTSSLDLSVQAQILNLLEDLRQEYSLTYFLISHNLDVIAHLSDRIAVMSAGRIVESGATRAIMENPSHPFTKQLLHAHSAAKTPIDVPPFDLDVWQDAPLNRWAFQHVDEFIPTRRIEPSKSPHIWRVCLDPSLAKLEIECEGETVSLDSLLEELCTDSFLVVKHGEIVMERYFNGMGPKSRHLLQSVSKSLLGILVGQLVDDGLIDLSLTLGHYLPDLKNSGYFDATVRDAMDMAVALKFSEEYHDVNSEIQRMDRAASWRHRRIGDPIGISQFINTVHKNGKHGVQFQYCSTNTDLLALLVSRVTGRPYWQVLSERVWQPIGAASSANITIDDLGDCVASGGISATTRDIALLGQLILNRGIMNGVEVVSPTWIEDTENGAPQSVASVEYLQALHPGASYRNQWWITKGENQEMYGVGIYGQYLWVDPKNETVIMKFSTLPLATSSAHSRKHMALFKKISAAR
jgi:hypothetical protein